jgi:hypothetical protein
MLTGIFITGQDADRSIRLGEVRRPICRSERSSSRNRSPRTLDGRRGRNQPATGVESKTAKVDGERMAWPPVDCGTDYGVRSVPCSLDWRSRRRTDVTICDAWAHLWGAPRLRLLRRGSARRICVVSNGPGPFSYLPYLRVCMLTV